MRETTPDLTRISKYISLILRHKPEVIGIKLDTHGWADVNALLAGISRKYPINRDILEEIVRSDEKQRYSFSEDGTKIRANQGHSIQVDVELPVTDTEQPSGLPPPSRSRDCFPKAACMSICPQIPKPPKK